MPEEERPKKPPEGLATGRIRGKVTPYLREWYGDGASDEMLKYLPEAANVGTLLTRFLNRRIPKAGRVVFAIRTKWTEIAGAVTAKRTRPFCYRDGILDIEVAHPAFLVIQAGIADHDVEQRSRRYVFERKTLLVQTDEAWFS